MQFSFFRNLTFFAILLFLLVKCLFVYTLVPFSRLAFLNISFFVFLPINFIMILSGLSRKLFFRVWQAEMSNVFMLSSSLLFT